MPLKLKLPPENDLKEDLEFVNDLLNKIHKIKIFEKEDLLFGESLQD